VTSRCARSLPGRSLISAASTARRAQSHRAPARCGAAPRPRATARAVPHPRTPANDPERQASQQAARRSGRADATTRPVIMPNSHAAPIAAGHSHRPASGTPQAHQSGKPGKLKGLRRVRANPSAIWMTWRLPASGPPPAPRSVGTRLPLGFSVLLSSGSWQAARVPAGCSALLSCISGRGCLYREPARPARRRARHGALRSGDRGGDRGGRRCRLRDGIRRTCARCLLPATTWSPRRGRASCSCSWAGP
jgi:hypothetical protein